MGAENDFRMGKSLFIRPVASMGCLRGDEPHGLAGTALDQAGQVAGIDPGDLGVAAEGGAVVQGDDGLAVGRYLDRAREHGFRDQGSAMPGEAAGGVWAGRAVGRVLGSPGKSLRGSICTVPVAPIAPESIPHAVALAGDAPLGFEQAALAFCVVLLPLRTRPDAKRARVAIGAPLVG